MSSSSRERGPARALVVVAGLCVAGAASGADTYFQPNLEAVSEYHSNWDLTPDPEGTLRDQTVMGFRADLGANWGIRTQRSDTRLRPTLRLQEVPDRDDLGRLSGSLSLQNSYRWQRSQWGVVGSYSREDASRAQIIDAGFDDFDPEDPIVDGTARLVVAAEKVNRLQVRPSFTHALSQKVDIETGALWYSTERDSPVPSRELDAKAWGVQGGVRWGMRPRTSAALGTYYARYEAQNDLNTTTGVGVSARVEHEWTPVLRGELSVDVEQTEVDAANLGRDKFTSIGPSAQIIRRGQVGEWRLVAGRTFSPTSYGTRSNVDQVRFELRRAVRPLLDMRLSLRGLRTRAQGEGLTGSSDRDYARGDLELTRRLSRTLYVRGSYSYVHQEYKDDVSGASGHIVQLGFGYRGLAPPSR